MPSRAARLSPAEIETLRRSLEPEEREAALARMRAGLPGEIARGSRGRTGRVRDRIGRLAGVSGRTVEKIAEVFAAAEADPARYGAIAAEMERTGKVDGAWLKVQRLRDEERVLQLAPAPGRFRTLVLDPPWDVDGLSDACGPAYARMDLPAIAALPVPGWAEAECHLYLWVTNNALGLALPLLAGWGFAYKTTHTWTKPALGRGRYFRNTTEHVLFGIRGRRGTRPAGTATPTHHAWPVGAHSEKPEGFYELVRRCSYPPYGEAFQRRARPDFADLFRRAAEAA
ncbi:MT-A70 family methyltransferase [Methylobacterium sp. JK268]